MSDPLFVEIALSWRWRCPSEAKLIDGLDLRVTIEGSSRTRPLTNWKLPSVDPSQLRCGCGCSVEPVMPTYLVRR